MGGRAHLRDCAATLIIAAALLALPTAAGAVTPRAGTYSSRAGGVPKPEVAFAVKGGRFITHLKRLRDIDAPLANFFASGLLALGAKLGPVLWQLPETLAFDAAAVDDFLGRLPRSTTEAAALATRHDGRLDEDRVDARVRVEMPLRHAVEPRSKTFADEEFYGILRAHGVGCVLADTGAVAEVDQAQHRGSRCRMIIASAATAVAAHIVTAAAVVLNCRLRWPADTGRWPVLDRRTSDLRYVRLHGDQELYASGYTDAALDAWAGRCRQWLADGEDVFVFFDNDAKGYAPHDARRLLQLLRDTGHA